MNNQDVTDRHNIQVMWLMTNMIDPRHVEGICCQVVELSEGSM